MAEGQAQPAALLAGCLWPQLLGLGEQARLSGREARAGMKRPFMAHTKTVCEHGRLASGLCAQSEH